MCYLIASFTATVNLYAATLISNTGSMSDIIKERLKIIFLAVPLLHRDVVQKTRTDDHLALSTVFL